MFTGGELQKFAASILDPKEKVTLVCGEHHHAYRDGKPPVFKCKQCWMVEFVGLLCNTPQERWDEVIEMLEYSIHHMIESAERGELQQMEFMKRPIVAINGKPILTDTEKN